MCLWCCAGSVGPAHLPKGSESGLSGWVDYPRILMWWVASETVVARVFLLGSLQHPGRLRVMTSSGGAVFLGPSRIAYAPAAAAKMRSLSACLAFDAEECSGCVLFDVL